MRCFSISSSSPFHFLVYNSVRDLFKVEARCDLILRLLSEVRDDTLFTFFLSKSFSSKTERTS